jgi:signal peptidase I
MRKRSRPPDILGPILKRLNGLELQQAAEAEFDKIVPEIEDYNVEQLNSGIRADGKKITPPYKPKTVSIKRKKGQPTDKVTLKDYGDFHSQIRVKKYPTKFELVSYDEKSEKLQDKYTPEILGLTDDNINKIKKAIFIKMKKNVRKLFRLQKI